MAIRLDTGYSIDDRRTKRGQCVLVSDAHGIPRTGDCYSDRVDIKSGRALDIFDRCHSMNGIRTVYGVVPRGVKSVRLLRSDGSVVAGQVSGTAMAAETRIGPGHPSVDEIEWQSRVGRRLALHPLLRGVPDGCVTG